MRNTKFLIFAYVLYFSMGLFSDKPNAEESQHLERIEWTDVWVTDADKNDLPRVLLVGDSIVRGYFDEVEKRLLGKAYCARYTTSLFMGNPDFIEELKILLKRYDFEVIHINNGLHGWDYTEAEYAASFPKLMECLKENAPGAKIVWATTTPVRSADDLQNFDAKNERAIERNTIAVSIMNDAVIPINDLYALVFDHPEYFSPDGVHFSQQGQDAQGKLVAEFLLHQLGK